MIGEYIQFVGLKFEVNKTAGRIVRSRLRSQRNYLFLDYYQQSDRLVHDNMSNVFSGAKATAKASVNQKKKKKKTSKQKRGLEKSLAAHVPASLTKNIQRPPLQLPPTGFAAGEFTDERYPMIS